MRGIIETTHAASHPTARFVASEDKQTACEACFGGYPGAKRRRRAASAAELWNAVKKKARGAFPAPDLSQTVLGELCLGRFYATAETVSAAGAFVAGVVARRSASAAVSAIAA